MTSCVSYADAPTLRVPCDTRNFLFQCLSCSLEPDSSLRVSCYEGGYAMGGYEYVPMASVQVIHPTILMIAYDPRISHIFGHGVTA
jgi:hypothetical protein